MKRLLHYLLFSVTAAAVMLTTACGDDGETIVVKAAEVAISLVSSSDEGEVTVKITTNEQTVRYQYAIGMESDLAAFAAGTLEGIESSDNGQAGEVEFTDLEGGQTYVVFARGYSSDNSEGPVATLKVKIDASGFNLRVRFATDTSAGIKAIGGDECLQYVFGLGKPGMADQFRSEIEEMGYSGTVSRFNSEVFEDGVLVSVMEIPNYSNNYFELTPGTDYVAYGYALLRDGGEIFVEEPFTTRTAGSFPEVDFTIIEQNAYATIFRAIPSSDEISRIVMTPIVKNTVDEVIHNHWGYASDLVNWMEGWIGAGMSVYSADGSSFDFLYPDPTMTPGLTLQVYSLWYGPDNEVIGVKIDEAKTFTIDPNATKPSLSLTVTNVTQHGADYNFVPSENTMSFYFFVMDDFLYQDILSFTNDIDEYMREFFQNFTGLDSNWKYGNEPATYTEFDEYVIPSGTTMHLFAMPVNVNGFQNGWGDVVYQSYTTLP